MNDGLKQLQEEGIKWVDANKSKRFSGVTKLLTDLYPDNAHFIYELLQNAEDARDKTRSNSRGASVVRFTLNTDSLEFEHDGEGLFNLANVESITGIGDSNKSDDPTSIGKFGIGFKAVFAYTNTPEIHSGDYHFRIHDLVVPEPAEPCHMGDRATKFVFPFNHPKKSAKQAETEITKGLCELGDNTLLFLKHIRKIEYLLPDGSLGTLERIKCDKGHIEIRAYHPSGKETISHWILFEKDDVQVIDENDKPKSCRIAIAFSLMNIANDDTTPVRKVSPLNRGQVSIYFPAEKETSNLHFHVHAPFASTVARDSVRRDCAANKTLIDAIADLTANNLATLRDGKFLDISSYSAFPLKKSDFSPNEQGIPHLFCPVYDKVREALKTLQLLPADGGGFIKADEAKLVRGKELVELFSPEQLGSLFGKERLAWLDASITESGGTADLHTYLVGRKKNSWTKEWELEPLIEGIQVDADILAPKLTAEFLGNQSMDWLLRFIPFAMGIKDLKSTSFIRLTGGKQVALPSDSKAPRTAWFVSQDTANLDLSVFPLVHSDLVADSEVRKLLEKEGIRPIDAAAIVEKVVLPEYQGKNAAFDEPRYREHLRQIRKAHVESNDAAKKQLGTGSNSIAWVACIHASGNTPDRIIWKEPSAIDVFEQKPEHASWFKGLDNINAYFPHPSVTEELKDVFSSLVKPAASLTQNLYPTEYTVTLKSERGNNKQGLNGFKQDATVFGLQFALDSWNNERALILWRIMLGAPRIISGITQYASNKNDLNAAEKKLEFTGVGDLCRERAWLPDRNGVWHKPSEVLLSDLPDEFDTTSVRAKEVADKLGMKRPVSSETIKALGFSSEDELRRAQAIVQSPDEFREFEEFKRRRQEEANSKPALPNKTSPDPKRREEKIAEEARNTPEKTQETRERTVDPDYGGVQDDARTYLKHQYTNDDGAMFCQLCQAPQPVILNGAPHFEAVTCVRDINAHHEQNNLALCPNHAAMYDKGGLNPDTVQRAVLECESQRIPLNLAGNQVELYFTQQHLGDLRAVLTALGSKEI